MDINITDKEYKDFLKLCTKIATSDNNEFAEFKPICTKVIAESLMNYIKDNSNDEQQVIKVEDDEDEHFDTYYDYELTDEDNYTISIGKQEQFCMSWTDTRGKKEWLFLNKNNAAMLGMVLDVIISKGFDSELINASIADGCLCSANVHTQLLRKTVKISVVDLGSKYTVTLDNDELTIEKENPIYITMRGFNNIKKLCSFLKHHYVWL